VKLGNYVNIRTGKLDANAADVAGKYPFFTCSSEPLKINTYSFDCECVLVAGNGELNAKYYNGKFDAYQRTYVIESKDDSLYTKYLYYFFINYIKELRKQAIGGVIKYIKLGNLTDADIKLPDIETQKNIVKELSKINLEIEKCRKNIKSLEELTKSRFIEMFGHPVLSKKYNVVTIADMVKKGNALIKAGPFGSSLKKEYYVKSGYKIYGQEQVINDNPFLGDYYIDEQKYRSLISCKVELGDVLISLVGTCGKTMIIPDNYEKGIINPRLLKIHFRNDYINPIYFKCFFADEELQKDLANKSGHSTMNVMNVSILKNVNVIVPPIELQDEFASFIEQVDKLKFTKKEQLLHYS